MWLCGYVAMRQTVRACLGVSEGGGRTRLDTKEISIISILTPTSRDHFRRWALRTAAPRCGASAAGSTSPPRNLIIVEPTAYELKVSHHSLANLAAFCIIASADLYHLGLSCLPVHLCARS